MCVASIIWSALSAALLVATSSSLVVFASAKSSKCAYSGRKSLDSTNVLLGFSQTLATSLGRNHRLLLISMVFPYGIG
jgi:hypothetical protein